MQRLRGLRDLVHDLIEKTTDLVQETHDSVAKKPVEVLSHVETLREPTRLVDAVRKATSDLVFDSIRATNRGVQFVEELGFVAAEKLLGTLGEAGPALDPELRRSVELWAGMAQAAINAAAGDFLHTRENGLSIRMGFRHRQRWLTPSREALEAAYPRLSGKLVVFIHGLGCAEDGFELFGRELHQREGASYASLLQEELDYTPFYVRYNTGRHVSENGAELSQLIEQLVASYPVPLEHIALVGHSMGGLVARSAAHYGRLQNTRWVGELTHVVCLGSPHMGAPLEKFGHLLASLLEAVDLPGTQVPAKILNARSNGIKDLRHGYILDEDWRDELQAEGEQRPPRPLLEGVTYCAIASTVTDDDAHPVAKVMGDLLVQVESASGAHPDITRRIPFHDARVLGGLNHIALLNHPRVYTELKRCLSPRAREEIAALPNPEPALPSSEPG